MSLADYRKGELRFRALGHAQPTEAERLLGLAQQAADQRWRLYEEMATRGASEFPSEPAGQLMDLSTNYMGLALRNPLVASPSPLSYTLDGVRRLADGGVGAIVLFSLFEEQLREEAARDRPARRGARRELPRGARLLPRRGRGGRGPRSYLRPARARGRDRRSPGDREPERRHPRGVDRICARDAGRRRRRDRAEHLLPPG